MKKERNYSIDLLKCISMLMIAFLHVNNYGLRIAKYNNFSMLGVSRDILDSFSIVGVNVFVLISGYYLSRDKVILNKESLIKRYKRLLPLWIQVEMYSVGIYLLLCAITQSGIQLNYRQLIKQALPLFTNQYWFFTIYFLLVIVSPFINKLIWQLEQKEYRVMLVVVLTIFSVVPTISIFGNGFGTEYGYSLVWFIVLYLVGGYISKFNVTIKNCKKWYFVSVVVLFACNLLSNAPIGILAAFLKRYSSYTCVFVVASAVLLFISFLNSNYKYEKSGKIISLLSSLTFAVYLIHEHPLFRDILWRKIVCLENYADNQFLCILAMIISAFAIYFAGISVEFIRSRCIRFLTKTFKKTRKDS